MIDIVFMHTEKPGLSFKVSPEMAVKGAGNGYRRLPEEGLD